LSENVILFYDGDVAGKMAAVRSGGPLYSAGVSPKVLFPPKGMDPDDWAKASAPEEITRRISTAVPLMESIERGAARKYDLGTISGKLSYVRLMEKYLRWITDPAERELYVQRVAQSAGLPVETIHRQLGSRKGTAPDAPDSPPRDRQERPEEGLLLQLLAVAPDLAADARRDGVEALLTGEDAKEALAYLAARVEGSGTVDADSMLGEGLPEGARRRLSAELVRADTTPEEARRRYPAALLSLRIARARRHVEEMQEKVKAASGREVAELFDRTLAAKKELERLLSERRSR
jgi:DNA primase